MSKHAKRPVVTLYIGDVVKPRRGGDRAVVIESVTGSGVGAARDQGVMVRPLRKSARWLTHWHDASELRVVKRRKS